MHTRKGKDNQPTNRKPGKLHKGQWNLLRLLGIPVIKWIFPISNCARPVLLSLLLNKNTDNFMSRISSRKGQGTRPVALLATLTAMTFFPGFSCHFQTQWLCADPNAGCRQTSLDSPSAWNWRQWSQFGGCRSNSAGSFVCNLWLRRKGNWQNPCMDHLTSAYDRPQVKIETNWWPYLKYLHTLVLIDCLKVMRKETSAMQGWENWTIRSYWCIVRHT